MILAILATLGAVVVAFVLYPVFAASEDDGVKPLTELAKEIEALEDKKTRLYESLTDLDFEKAAGKVSETDYQSARNDYLAQVAQVIERLDAIAPPELENEAPETPAPEGDRTAGRRRCASCGEANPGAAKFCFRCGTAFPEARTCDGCGAALPEAAKFCMTCGKKVTNPT